MTPMQQILLGVGAKKKVYSDELFNTYVYKGNNSSRTLNVGIDFTTDGGATFIKNRDESESWAVFDTVRGNGKLLHFNSNAAQSESFARQNNFSTTGFDVGAEAETNGSGDKMVSFNLRKAPGFFEILTWTGNYQNNHQISHSLGSVPGFIIIKRVNNTEDWTCLQRDMPINSWIDFNGTATGGANYSGLWNDVRPTATHLNLGANQRVNGNGDTYIGYLFAGGESTAATARSLDFTPNAHLTVGDHADYRPGTDDFTLEAWLKPDTWNNGVGFWHTINGLTISKTGSGKLGICTNATSTLAASHDPELGQWTHVAVCRSGSTIRMFYNGTQVAEGSNSVNYGGTGTLTSGHTDYFDGKISNLRMVKGTALYTSSFRPPTEPLTNITNTKLLICNNSDPTAGTVLPTTINNSGAVASTDSPFDDPAGFVFGDDGKQNLVKTGSYIGNGSSDGPKVYIGWEPAFLIIRRFTGGTADWRIFDNMRGLTGDGLADCFLESNTTDSEVNHLNCVDISPTGFEPKSSDTNWNNTGDKYIYIAIRRNDGFVSKPADAGTDAFALDTGSGSSDNQIPTFDSGFPVDFATMRKPGSQEDWYVSSRLTNTQYMHFNNNAAENGYSGFNFDMNGGWAHHSSYNSNYQSWMWKRGQGFDVVTTYGGSGKYVPHSLGRVPEMMILKARNNAQDWRVYHHGVNNGVNPEQYGMVINSTAGQNQNIGHWHNTAPTATHFRTGTWDSGGANSSYQYRILLFASISGISKCGYYTGNGVKTGNVQTLGFQPRFILIKCTDTSSTSWMVFDTLLGINSGDDNLLQLNSDASTSAGDYIDLTSDGFDVVEDLSSVNGNNKKYIYYAHA